MVRKKYYLFVFFAFITSTLPQSIMSLQTSGNLPLSPNKPLLLSPTKFSFNYNSLNSLSFLKPRLSWVDNAIAAGIWAWVNPYTNAALMLGLQCARNYFSTRYGWGAKPVNNTVEKQVKNYTTSLGYQNLIKKDAPTFNFYHNPNHETLDVNLRTSKVFDPNVYDVSYNSFYLPNGRTDVDENARPVLRAIALSRLSQHWVKRDLVPLLGNATFGFAAQLGINFLTHHLIKKTSSLNNQFIDFGAQILSIIAGVEAADYAQNFILGWYHSWISQSAENNALKKLTDSFGTKKLVTAQNLKAYKDWLEKVRSKQLCYTKRAIVEQLIFEKIIPDCFTPAEVQALCLSSELFEEITNNYNNNSKQALLQEIEILTGIQNKTLQEEICNAIKKWQTQKMWQNVVDTAFWPLSQEACKQYTHYFPANHTLKNRIETMDSILEKEDIKNVLEEEDKQKNEKKN